MTAQRKSSGLEPVPPSALSVVEVELDRIDGPEAQLRVDLDPDRLQELASSIGKEGLIQPPVVRVVGDRYRVVAGHRRTEACRLLGWRRIPVILRQGAASGDLAAAAHENLFRHDLSAVEEAGAVAALVEASGGDVDVAARAINRSRGWVDSRLRILAWPIDIQQAVHAGGISAGAGAELAAVTDDQHRAFLLSHAVASGATTRTCQAWRIAWEQTGLPSTAAVAQVPVGGVLAEPAEAELPCYVCGFRHRYSELTHVWVCASGLELIQGVAEAMRDDVSGAGAPGTGGGGGRPGA